MQVDSELQRAPNVRAAGASPVGSWELRPGDGRLTCSIDARRIFGLDMDATSAPVEALFALAAPADARHLRVAFHQAMEAGAPLDVSCRFPHADGDRHLHLKAEHVPGERGPSGRLWGTVHDVTDRPRISSALRESEIARAEADEARAQAARILEGVSDAFVALDRQWRYTHVNAKAASVFGRTPEDLIGTHIWTEFPEGVGQPFYHAYHRAMEEHTFVFLEEHYAPYDRWFENRIYPTPDGIAIFFHDITDRHRAAEAMAESEERFRQLADNIQEVFWLWGVEQDAFIYISPAFEAIWQRSRDEVYASPRIWPTYIHPDDRPAVMSALPRRATGEYDEEYRIVRPDGSVRWISDRAFPVRDAAGGVRRIAGVAQDITDRHEAQEVIQRIASGLTTTLESITDAFYTLDEQWRFTYVNHEAERLMQRSRAELLGVSVWDAFPEAVDTEFHRQFHRAVREATAAHFDDFYPPLNCWFEVRAFPSAQGLAVYFLDVTERRRAADELRSFALRLESAQDAERSSIAREVHDELGQALTVLRMDATRLGKLSVPNREFTELVRDMTEVIDATLQRTRSIAVALHPSALDDLGLAAAIEIHANHVGRRAELEISLDLQPVSARVDRGRARAAYRVLQESLTNVVRHADATHVSIHLAELASELLLEVEDDGCGILPEQLTGGGSLGLLGMRERAAAFGGRVTFTPVDPCGTRVSLHIPLPP